MALTYMSIIIVILIFLNYYPIVAVRDFIVTAKQEEMISNANAISLITAEKMSQGVRDYGTGFVGLLYTRDYDRLIITDEEAKVIYDSAKSDNLTGKLTMVGEIYLALNGKEIFRDKFQKEQFEFVASVPILVGNRVAGAVYIHKLSRQEIAILKSTQRYILIFSVLLTVIVIILSLFFSRVLTEQIRYLNLGIGRMKEGDYDTKIPVKTNDELGLLADAFNEFSQKMNITEQRRREFVSDASHELKTPLSSIKLLVDSINESDNLDQNLLREFMSDISLEIDRLVRITERLFTLTRLDESTKLKPDVVVDTKRVIQNAIRLITPIAAERGIIIQNQLEEGVFILAVSDSFSQIVYNLLDNAVKYNYDGGVVEISMVKREKNAVLTVMDNGVGISKEEIEKIFERFYRVDKARSRDTGGTGLGLAIVKENVELMGGEIEVESILGEGTAFTVTLPLFKD
jgi:signal transduction histidine kinase